VDAPPSDSRPESNALRSQAKANRSTRDHWNYFTSHRAEIQSLVLPDLFASPDAGKTLCVLGAGNCNDVDLKALSAGFREVTLVDIDGAALGDAVRRQGVDGAPGVRLRGGIDLTGIADLFPLWEQSPPDVSAVMGGARRALEAPGPDAGGPFDVVLSPCLLSQLVGYASDVLGRSHAARRELLLALRTRHLRTLVDLIAPGGTGVVVCDVASSTRHPELLHMRREKLGGYLDRLAYTDRGFDGLSPVSMRAALESDPLIAPLLAPVQQIAPWLWHLGPRRTFLVYGLRLRRRQGAVVLSR
jgi:hypothetical protein